MDKNSKRFWRYFGAILVLLEVCINFLLIQNSSPWQVVRVVFLLVNAAVMAYLIQIKLKVEKHNAQINAAANAQQS